MEKRILTVLLAAMAVVGLAATAFADVISPGELILYELGGALPWLLVIAVVIVTVLLLRRRKK